MKKLMVTSILVGLVHLGLAAPVLAQQAQIVRVNVIVTNAETNEPLMSMEVRYDEPPIACNGQHGEHVTSRTTREGETAMAFITCTGTATVTVAGGQDFETQQQSLEIEPGQAGYNVFFKLVPRGRVVHIRVQGRNESGELVAVPSATVYDRSGNQLATTDAGGMATARVKEVLGETVTLRAEARNWKQASASYIVGAYHSGSKITRSEDYVNFVLNGEEERAKQEISLQILVQGTEHGKRVAVDHALIYSETGEYLTSTDAGGHAAAIVKVPFGETFRLKAEAHRWNSETVSLLARSETRGAYAGPAGSKYLYQQVKFSLQPATNEVGDLVIEVLDRTTDKPVPAASVHLYKPTGFPGTLMGVETTDHQGEVTFDSRHVESALAGQETRVGVTHGGYEEAVQTVAASLTTTESPRYVAYLKPKTENTKWSGAWFEGPYKIQISGGTGSLGYTELRSDGAGTCCPLVDQSGGNCQVIGSKAICQYHGHYHDSAKDVDYSGHVTLTLSGDTIQYSFTQVAGSIKLSSGQECPDIRQCTALHPGAVFTGYWSRKKP